MSCRMPTWAWEFWNQMHVKLLSKGSNSTYTHIQVFKPKESKRFFERYGDSCKYDYSDPYIQQISYLTIFLKSFQFDFSKTRIYNGS